MVQIRIRGTAYSKSLVDRYDEIDEDYDNNNNNNYNDDDNDDNDFTMIFDLVVIR